MTGTPKRDVLIVGGGHNGLICDSYLAKAGLSVTFAGPKTPGSAYVIMHHIMGEHEGAGGWGFIRGGMGRISEAIAGYGRSVGLETVTGAWVERVKVANGRVTGIATRDGREFDANIVVCNASAKALYLDMIEERHLPGELVRDIRNMRTFSTAFKLDPEFPLGRDRCPGGIGDDGDTGHQFHEIAVSI